ncbi:MAG: amidophosphoribosyltransferase [Phycisphaerales bacterium]
MGPVVSLPVLDRGFPGGGPKEKCGVLGVWGHPDAVHLTYLGLYAQQHRGQESAGIAVTDGVRISGHTGMGLVPDVFDERTLADLESARRGVRRRIGQATGGVIGHNRYSTTGASVACNAQPLIERFVAGEVAVAHNGNLINAEALREMFGESGHLFHTTSDTEVVIHLLASPEQRRSPDPLAATLRRLQGAFSMVFLFPDRIEAARDPWGWRPLVLGRFPDGRDCVASETVALDVMGAEVVREVEPGEIVTLSDSGVESRRFAPPAERLARCVFEHVYFANPASHVFGQNVLVAREAMGAKLAEEAPADADYVMPMPDSGRSAANGYARRQRHPVPRGHRAQPVCRADVHRRRRASGSVVRSQAQHRLRDRLRAPHHRGGRPRSRARHDDAGEDGPAREARASRSTPAISCPPITHPCWGRDFATPGQLIVHDMSVEEIRAYLGVDSPAYLELRHEGLLGDEPRPRELLHGVLHGRLPHRRRPPDDRAGGVQRRWGCSSGACTRRTSLEESVLPTHAGSRGHGDLGG